MVGAVGHDLGLAQLVAQGLGFLLGWEGGEGVVVVTKGVALLATTDDEQAQLLHLVSAGWGMNRHSYW